MNKEEQVLASTRELFNKLSWLNKQTMKDRFADFKSSEIHCLEFIGSSEEANVTKLAEAFYMTRGAISKLTKKLVQKGVLESYQKPDNKKEIYFRLTAEGQAIYQTHEKLHREFMERDQPAFAQLTEAQYDSMMQFIEVYRKHLDEEIRKYQAAQLD